MNSNSNVGNKLKMMVISAVFGALLIAVQIALGFLPNIELVTTLLMVFSAVCGGYTFISVYVFVLAEGLIHGFGPWWIGYTYVWLIPVVVGVIMKKCKNSLLPAAFSALFGLSFGLLTAPPILLIEKYATLPYLVANIPYDILHCVGNGVLTAVLYLPLRTVLQKSIDKIKKQ